MDEPPSPPKTEPVPYAAPAISWEHELVALAACSAGCSPSCCFGTEHCEGPICVPG